MVIGRMTRRTTHARDDLALHEQPDGGVDAVDVALHRQLEVVLGLVPLHCHLSSAYSSLHDLGALRSPCEIKGTEASTCMGEREETRTRSSLPCNAPVETLSVARLLGPKESVSCRPWAFAVSLTLAVLG
jgi:hypothetical protein